MASAASAAPYTLSSRAASGQNVVYWGQNGGGTIENNDLAAYCTSSSGIDIIVLAFLYEYGNGNNIPSGTIWSEALIIYGIHEYIALLMNFGNIMGISRVSSNFYKVEMSKNEAFVSHIKSIISRF